MDTVRIRKKKNLLIATNHRIISKIVVDDENFNKSWNLGRMHENDPTPTIVNKQRAIKILLYITIKLKGLNTNKIK